MPSVGSNTTIHTCPDCGCRFTIAPPAAPERPCRRPTCTSYDAELDIDAQLAQGPVAARTPDGRRVMVSSVPLDPNRTVFLQGIADSVWSVVREVPPVGLPS